MNQAMRNGLTPLMAACLQGHEEVVKVLCRNQVAMETTMREALKALFLSNLTV